MEQRLIDSNELKTTLVNYACYAEYYPVSRMIELIDQCPTVEPQKVCVANVTFDDAKLREIVDEAVKKFRDEFEQPKGEWIKGREISREMISDKILHIDYENFTCSNCGLVLDNLLYHADGSPLYKYCPNCGADMRGSDKE